MEGNQKTFTTIDEYIAAFPAEVQVILNQIRAVIKAAAPEVEEKISYQMPTFAQNGNLVHFAAYKHHIGFYPTPSGIEKFVQELAGYEKSKGTLRFPIDQPIPYALISHITAFRVAENLEKARAKRPK